LKGASLFSTESEEKTTFYLLRSHQSIEVLYNIMDYSKYLNWYFSISLEQTVVLVFAKKTKKGLPFHFTVEKMEKNCAFLIEVGSMYRP